MKILAVVVTYYPQKELLNDNIKAFVDHVDKVLIWENTPEKEKLKYRFVQHDKIEYCGDGINSISHGLNYAWRYAKDNNFDYLLTMDQDSIFVNFDDYLKNAILNPNAPKGVYGPCINNECHQDDFFEMELITSGMLIKTTILDIIGGYNEHFRVDGIDTFLCCMAHKRGIKTYVVKGVILQQHFGDIYSVNFMGRDFKTVNYPPHRLYEIFKTKILFLKYFPMSSEYKANFYRTMLGKWLVKILFFENNKKNKITSIICGIKDGLKGKINYE